MNLSQVKSIKKVELHRHLEGCITSDFLKDFVPEFHPRHQFNNEEILADLYQYSTMQGFLNAWVQVIDLLDEVDHFKKLAEHVVTQLREENVVYAEFIFSPQPFHLKGISTEEVLDEMYNVFSNSGIVTHVNIDFVRNFGVDAFNEYLPELTRIRVDNDHLRDWITGISIGGDEMNYPPELFINSYKKAQENEFRLYAHAGEWKGSENVWTAIMQLGAERIGHGINAVQDKQLIEYLHNNGLGLDISITSNYFTGAVEKGDPHPVAELYNKGCKISLNTDDPGFFFTNLNDEYLKFVDMGFEYSDLKKICKDAIANSFATPEEKKKIRSIL